MIKKITIKNILVFAFPSREEFLEYIANKHKILVAVNSEKIIKTELKLHKIINTNIGYPDGVGAVMGLKQKGLDTVRIPGVEFWLDIIQKFHHNKSFYLIGSSQSIIDQTVKKLEDQFLGINIVAYRNGYLDEVAKVELKKDLLEKKPDIVFVAQGSPRQEYLMNELMQVHPALYMGLGGSFDVYCGFKKRAPRLFIKLNLEWLYRLLQEPTRLGRQLVLIKFLYLYFMKRL